MSFPLNNNTNTVRQAQYTWIKPESHQARSIHNSRELELQQKLKQSTMVASSSAAAAKSVHHDDFPKLPAVEIAARKKKFASFKFYLDNLDPLVSKRIERGIKLMGATHEPFFSKNCSHLITTKTIPIHENLLAPTANITNTTLTTKATANSKKYDPIVESAIQLNTVLWSADVMQKTVEFLMNVSIRKEVQEKRALGKVLQEEKLFGPSTGTNSEAQSRRPLFVPFTGHFLIIEDVTQVHRPPICKQWTKEVFTKKPAEYPWPYFKQTPKHRSPFGKKAPPPPPKNPADDGNVDGGVGDTVTGTTADTTNRNPAVNDLQENKENIPLQKQVSSAMAVIMPLTAPSTPSTPSPLSTQKVQQPLQPLQPQQLRQPHQLQKPQQPQQPQQTQQQPQQQPTITVAQKQLDSQNFSLRASGFHPSCTNNIQSASTRSVSTTVSILQGENRRLPPGDSVNRLDKRMVENVTLVEQKKLLKQKALQEEQARRERELKKKRDSRYCENCNTVFENLEEHSKQQTHQTFIRDQNNFKELDELLAKTHRRYKQPLPEHMRRLIDASIDGKHIEFVSDLKRSHPATPSLDASSSPQRKLSTASMMKKKSIPTSQPRIATNESTVNENEGWGQYGHVFL